jgi:hypothetical protein
VQTVLAHFAFDSDHVTRNSAAWTEFGSARPVTSSHTRCTRQCYVRTFALLDIPSTARICIDWRDQLCVLRVTICRDSNGADLAVRTASDNATNIFATPVITAGRSRTSLSVFPGNTTRMPLVSSAHSKQVTVRSPWAIEAWALRHYGETIRIGVISAGDIGERHCLLPTCPA